MSLEAAQKAVRSQGGLFNAGILWTRERGSIFRDFMRTRFIIADWSK